MPRVTISYRREDSGVITGRIFDRLIAHYGRDSVFRDIDNIPIGVDFRTHIEKVFDETDIVLAIVGPHWIGPSPDRNRMANPADPVRVEIEGALRRGARLVPVLVLGAPMPTTDDLPDTMHDFAYRNAVQIDAGQDFDMHMARLIRAIDDIFGLTGPTPPREPTPTPASKWLRYAAMAGVAAVVVIGGAIAALRFGNSDRPPAVQDNRPPVMEAATKPATPPPAPAASAPAQVAAATPPSPAAPAAAAAPVDADIVFWQSISASSNPADFQEYLRQYPQGRFAGLARNRVQALATPVPESRTATAAATPTPTAAGRCGGNSDQQVIQPVKQLYQAINANNFDLYAAQWTDDAVYRDLSRGTVYTKSEKLAETRDRFAKREYVKLTMDKSTIADRSADKATVNIVYSMTVKYPGRAPFSQVDAREDYTVICGKDGQWLINSNTDEITSGR